MFLLDKETPIFGTILSSFVLIVFITKFNRLAEYKDDALEWLQENPLSKFGGSKLERKKAFEQYLKDTAKNFNLFSNEVEYKP